MSDHEPESGRPPSESGSGDEPGAGPPPGGFTPPGSEAPPSSPPPGASAPPPPGAPPPPRPDQPPAPGWWKASDGNWYPPQQQQQQAAPPPPQPNQWAPPPPGAAAGQAAPGGAVYYTPGMTPQQSNGLATWALVLGILSILGFWAFGIGVLLGIVAVVLGVMGRNRAREMAGNGNEGRAVAGIVTGAIGIVGGVLFFVFIFAVWDEVVDEIETEFDDGVCEQDNPFDPDC